MDKKRLVAYFSATGVTKKVAKAIAEAAEADLYEIEAKDTYSAADLNWNDKNSRSVREWKNNASRPEIKAPVPNMEQYDVVFIGYPIWWESSPNIVYTFLESYDFSGKTIIPFSTSGGSVRGSEGTHLHLYCSKQANWKPGKVLRANLQLEAISQWIDE